MVKVKKDLTGRVFGRLTVLRQGEDYPRTGGKCPEAGYECRCECGTERNFRGSSLSQGFTKSCGCLSAERAAETARKHKPRQKAPGVSGFNSVLNTYKQGARARGLEWELTPDEFRALVTGPCEYCGAQENRVRTLPGSSVSLFRYTGVDRLDSDAGYRADNCVPCCTQCNVAKLDYTLDEFREWALRVADKFRKPA